MPILAAESEGIIGAVTTAVSTVTSDVMGGIGGVLPYALTVMGAFVTVGVVIAIYKKVTSNKG